MNDKEKRLRDARLIEATRKDYTGLEGKFGTILKYLGQPIITEGGSYYESTELQFDVYEQDEDKDELPTLDLDKTVMELGYIFDGLSSGIHLEIKYLSEKQELTVHYQGYLVFSETASELDCFVPEPIWESKIEMLYKRAKLREDKKKTEIKTENKQEAERQKLSLLERLRLKWGL